MTEAARIALLGEWMKGKEEYRSSDASGPAQDREHNLALLKKHIEDNATSGARLEDLRQVLPSLPETTVRSLLNTLKRRDEAYSAGRSRGAKWFPGHPPKGVDA